MQVKVKCLLQVITKHNKIPNCARINVFLKKTSLLRRRTGEKNLRLNIYTVKLQVSYETTRSLNIAFRLQ